MHRILVLLLLIIFSFANTIVSETSSIQNGTKKDNETKELEFSYVTAVNSTLLSTVSSTLETNELVRNLLHGVYMNDFHIFDFLESLQPSDCLQVCLDEVASMMDQPFAGQRSIDEIGNICSHFDIFQRCLHHKTSCKDALLGVTTAIIDYLCAINHDAFIYFTCDNQCKMGEVLSKASIEKKVEVTNILDGNGNKLLEVPTFYNLCSSSTCFINCIQNMAEKECSIGHSNLLHRIVAAVVSHTTKMNPSPEMKSSDAYTLLVSFILPNECQRLKLLPQDAMFTTPMTDFVDHVKYDGDEDAMRQNTTLTADSRENDAIWTVLSSHKKKQNSIYMQILPSNGYDMKLQCRMIDLKTGQEVTVADIAMLMTTTARNIFNEFDLRSMEDEQILEDNNAKYGSRSRFQDRKATTSKNKEYTQGSSNHLLPSHLTLLLMLLFQIY
ncbi:tRNA N6-adenosine threonylcarbamoyltransferase [Dirofilaria immitis]